MAGLRDAKIVEVRDHATALLDDGTQLAFAGLFAVSQSHPSSPLAAELGCTIATGPTGGTYIQTDAMKQTTVPKRICCG